MASLPIQLPQSQYNEAPRSAAADMVGKALPVRFSALEWSVVAMAEKDQLSSIREPGRVSRAINTVFGIKPANRLANDRLESLRRVAVLAWRYRWNVAKSAMSDFYASGFTPDHFELLQRSIAQAFAQRTRKTVR
ncbi:hypothetical protein H8M03_10520 [Sphingomonas sabuli]|uniref:Uncharacterized protein n=1 Tax=Sphingomonas sabuli TaxID=2764186 RepID=A0A7G9L1D6_9SPHN|nr:hypothetical protein [Sphingomonas sabuli]QNM82435.1 hypothetical protein H8M03_10520 [Sphingomonas sabuli]